MPPNLGGFFMVRSYYPSECHADYFDFERIEALKPAIEACGISTLSQSPMLGFHKQMDNRIKLLEEILSFRMQGVEFDNGDMYVDGHKAASDVRDEFVSVTEKLMDELAQCYNVLPQLDINNTIDHRPEGDEKWFLENEKTVTQFCRKLAAERPLKDIRDEYNYPKKKGIKDECSRLLEASTMKSRRGFAIQRLMNAMRQAHADGWFIVFDTLTLADDRLEAFMIIPMLCVTIFVILVVWFLLPRVARLMIHTPTAISIFLVSMQISISSLQTHNVNRCGRSRHLARKLSLRRKRSSPNVFEMAATENITSIILIKLIRVSLGTVRHPRRFKIVVIDIQITLKQMLRDFIGIRVNRAKKSGMVNITSSVNSRERSGINTILHELNPLFTINVTMRDIKSKNVYSRVNSKATTQWRKTESANGVHLEGVASDNRSS